MRPLIVASMEHYGLLYGVYQGSTLASVKASKHKTETLKP